MRRAAALAVTLVAALALAAPAAAVPPPGQRTPGIDVSRFQGEIDWLQVAEAGKRFAFVQASRGKGNDCGVKPQRCGPDEWYALNYAEAKLAGVTVGPYHRAFVGGKGRRTAKLDAKREARVFIETVGSLESTDLRPALDMEPPFGTLSARQLRLWTKTWLRKVERAFDTKAFIYTGSSSWSSLDQTPEFALAGHPLWVANWHVDAPLVPAGDWAGYSWTVWQWSSTGEVPGIDGNVDLDWLRGGLEAASVGGAGPVPAR